MTLAPTVRLRIYPDDCDAYGHVNQAAVLRFFERARWEALAQGPGVDVFSRAGCWPAIRRAAVDYYAPSFPGEELDISLTLTHLGRSSFSMHQVARRGNRVVAAGYFLAVCIDSRGKPTDVPPAIGESLGTRPAMTGTGPRYLLSRGLHIALDEMGDGPSILFIHGFPMDRTMWRPVMNALAGRHRIVPDLPGFGMSDGFADASPTMSDYADALAGILDQLGVERAAVCGLSMGGYVAFEMWRRHRKRISSLILMNTRAEPDGPEARAGRDRTAQHVGEEGMAALARAMVPKLLSAETLRGAPAVVEHVRTMILDNQAPGAVAALGAMRERPDSVPDLASIDVPVLVLAGENDAIVPVESARAMSDGIAGSKLAVLPGAGHVAPLEAPEESTRLLADFLGRLP